MTEMSQRTKKNQQSTENFINQASQCRQ